MKSAVIAAMTRTPIGKIGGTLKNVLPEDLTTVVMKEVVSRAGIDPSVIDEIIIGQTKQSTDAPNIARLAALKAGIPESVPGYTVHRQCASGMQAIINAVFQIQAGYADVIVAGGVESMSTAPYYMRKARYGYDSGNALLLDPNIESQPKSQPEDIYGTFNMGITAENVAKQYNISRQEQDEFAFESIQKTIQAIKDGRFSDEITPVPVPGKKGELISFVQDEHVRMDSTYEKLTKLKPAFMENGTVTAGNSTGRNDGAAAVVVMSEEKAKELGLRPMLRFTAAGVGGVDPRVMGIGPVPASLKALKMANLNLNDIGLIELNEAFAAQCLGVIKELRINRELLNVNGGAIGLGHPLGCSGARIVTTLGYEMIRRNVRYGLATLCVAGGLGVTTIYENLNI